MIITNETKISTVLSWRDRDRDAVFIDPLCDVVFAVSDVTELIDGNGNAILDIDLREIDLKTGMAIAMTDPGKSRNVFEYSRVYQAPITAILSNGLRVQSFVIASS